MQAWPLLVITAQKSHVRVLIVSAPFEKPRVLGELEIGPNIGLGRSKRIPQLQP
jgi:hypothetical protein